MLEDYIISGDSVSEVELSVTGASLGFYGVFGMIFMLSFQDYNALENKYEHKYAEEAVNG